MATKSKRFVPRTLGFWLGGLCVVIMLTSMVTSLGFEFQNLGYMHLSPEEVQLRQLALIVSGAMSLFCALHIAIYKRKKRMVMVFMLASTLIFLETFTGAKLYQAMMSISINARQGQSADMQLADQKNNLSNAGAGAAKSLTEVAGSIKDSRHTWAKLQATQDIKSAIGGLSDANKRAEEATNLLKTKGVTEAEIWAPAAWNGNRDLLPWVTLAMVLVLSLGAVIPGLVLGDYMADWLEEIESEADFERKLEAMPRPAPANEASYTYNMPSIKAATGQRGWLYMGKPKAPNVPDVPAAAPVAAPPNVPVQQAATAPNVPDVPQKPATGAKKRVRQVQTGQESTDSVKRTRVTGLTQDEYVQCKAGVESEQVKPTVQALQDAYGVGQSKAGAALQKMCNDGLLARKPSGRYVLAKPALDAA